MTRRWTIAILLGITALLIGWDIYVALTPQKGDTISEVIRDWAFAHPVIPFALGVLCGHWLWPLRERAEV